MNNIKPLTRTLEVGAAFLGIEDGQIIDQQTGRLFDAETYSQYKYGSGRAAGHVAATMVGRLVEVRTQQLMTTGEDILDDYYLSSSAYKHTPTAAYRVAHRMIGLLSANGFPPTGSFRIDRGVVKSGDYSAMTAAERELYIADNDVTIPRSSGHDIKGKTVVVVDDTKITGSNEKSFIIALEQHGVDTAVFCYAAILDPKLACEFPETESKINHVAMKSLVDLAEIASQPNFEVNARMCRHILEPGSYTEGEMLDFVNSIPYSVAVEILTHIIMDGYHKIEEYADTFDIFRHAVTARNGEAPKLQGILI